MKIERGKEGRKEEREEYMLYVLTRSLINVIDTHQVDGGTQRILQY